MDNLEMVVQVDLVDRRAVQLGVVLVHRHHLVQQATRQDRILLMGEVSLGLWETQEFQDFLPIRTETQIRQPAFLLTEMTTQLRLLVRLQIAR